MGTKNANGVLDTGRVVVSKAPGNPQRIVHWGEVVEIAGNTLTLSQEEGQADLKFPKTWKGPDKRELENGAKLIVITDSGANNIQTIKIIQ